MLQKIQTAPPLPPSDRMKRKDRRRHEAAGGGPNVSKRTGMSEAVREAARSEDLVEAVDAVKEVVTVRVGGARVELGAL